MQVIANLTEISRFKSKINATNMNKDLEMESGLSRENMYNKIHL